VLVLPFVSFWEVKRLSREAVLGVHLGVARVDISKKWSEGIVTVAVSGRA
jgi:hypothetical protein